MNIGEMQRLLSMKAEREPGHKFGDLYSLLCHSDWLWLAHDHVARNAGSKTAGCDGIAMTEFKADLEGNLQRLRLSLESETFVACPVRRVNIPKGNGKVRPLEAVEKRHTVHNLRVFRDLDHLFKRTPGHGVSHAATLSERPERQSVGTGNGSFCGGRNRPTS